MNLIALPSMCWTCQREVPSLVSWLYCFSLTLRCVHLTRQPMICWLNGHLITREALRHGGHGWQEYDRRFADNVNSIPHSRGIPCYPTCRPLPSLANARVEAPFAHSAEGPITPTSSVRWHLSSSKGHRQALHSS